MLKKTRPTNSRSFMSQRVGLVFRWLWQKADTCNAALGYHHGKCRQMLFPMEPVFCDIEFMDVGVLDEKALELKHLRYIARGQQVSGAAL